MRHANGYKEYAAIKLLMAVPRNHQVWRQTLSGQNICGLCSYPIVLGRSKKAIPKKKPK